MKEDISVVSLSSLSDTNKIKEVNEIWKDIVGFPGYRISNLGRLRGLKGRICKISPRPDGYVRTALYDDSGSSVNKMIHVLVAKAFLVNPNNKQFVNHINGKRSDNVVDNLEWVTRKENLQRIVFPNYGHRKRPVIQCALNGAELKVWSSAREAADFLSVNRSNIATACKKRNAIVGGFKWKHLPAIVIEGEEWRMLNIDGKDINVSSAGRVETKTGMITLGSQTAAGYMTVELGLVHRLVAVAFLPEPHDPEQTYVNHIDHNKTNNKVCNLEWITPSENTKHGYQNPEHAKKKRRMSVGVKQIDIVTGETIATFPSVSEASKHLGTSKGNITTVCRKKRNFAGGFKLEYVEDIE